MFRISKFEINQRDFLDFYDFHVLRLSKLEINQVVLIDTFWGEFSRDHRVVCSVLSTYLLQNERLEMNT